MTIPLLATFGALDWAVLSGYFVLLAATGIVFSLRKNENTEDYFLGGRGMPAWAVAVSVLATGLSAATFVGGPQQAFDGNLTYLATNLGMIIAAVAVGLLFLPAFYREKVATVYGLLERRFGTGAMRAASLAFLMGRVLASGSRVYIVGIPAALILFGAQPDAQIPAWQIIAAIGVMTAVGIVYTLVGGVASVIWTDVIQMAVFVVAIVGAMLVLFDRIPIGLGEVFGELSAAGEDGASKLTLIDTGFRNGAGFDFSAPFSLPAILVGFTLLGIASYGTDQDMVQRMLTCKDAKRGAWSVISANLLTIPVVSLFLIVGLLLFVFYRRPDLMGEASPGYEVFDSSRVFLSFILQELPAGLTGLMMAGLFAAGLSSLNSGLNSMSSTVINDFYRGLRPGRSERQYLFAARVCVVCWGLVLGGFASVCVYWQRADGQTLINFALGVMSFAYAGLLGVFFTALLTRRGNTISVIASLLVGFIAVLVMQPVFWGWFVDLEQTRAAVSLGGDRPWWLVAVDLAFPWKLALASVISFGVCCLGSSDRKTLENAGAVTP
ncbi:MAG: sodium:solute symporter [Planctomycetota bacterium]